MTTVLPTRLAAGDAPLAIETHALSRRYGAQTALRDLALEVPAGAVYLLVGPNGAGKSTTLRLLLDLTRADAGRATVLGLDVRTQAARVRANVGYVPDRQEWGYGFMRVGRLLEHHARYFPSWDTDYAARLMRAFELQPEQRFGTLSKGQARRVHLLLALAHRPPLLLLDEPTDGLDPVVRDETLGLLAEHLAETPTTVLISTHHVGALRDGELRAQLPLHALRQGLRRYRAEVPDGWRGVPTLNGAVLRRAGAPREVQWTVWGAESEIVHAFAQSGATVREAVPLSLPEATLALLQRSSES